MDKKPKPVKVGKASVVACDLDGVIGDIVQQLLLFFHRNHGLSLATADIVSENFDVFTPIRRDQLQKFFENDEFFRSLPLMLGSREAMLRLRAAGCEIHIVTDRFWYREIDRDTTDWLTKNEIPFDSVIFARRVESHISRRSSQRIGSSKIDCLMPSCSRQFAVCSSLTAPTIREAHPKA